MANLDNIEPFLSLVVKKGNLDTVKSLIEKGADINAVDNEGNTPLHLATKDNKLQYKTDKLDLVKFLVSRGAC